MVLMQNAIHHRIAQVEVGAEVSIFARSVIAPFGCSPSRFFETSQAFFDRPVAVRACCWRCGRAAPATHFICRERADIRLARGDKIFRKLGHLSEAVARKVQPAAKGTEEIAAEPEHIANDAVANILLLFSFAGLVSSKRRLNSPSVPLCEPKKFRTNALGMP
jgi:hypothetical protein